ncbi:MAG: carboxypeptidase regulatory-like domain-containing protein, partial [Blastocatellia bacterium]
MSDRKLFICLSILLLQQTITAQTPAKPAPVGTATVTGRVTIKGEPARGVTVFLRHQPGPGPAPPTGGPASGWPSAKTDEAGRFRFTSVAAGRHTILAAAPGYVSADDSQFGPRGKTLNVADGENVENVDIALQRGGVITGRVTNSQGQPLVDERVTLGKLDKTGKPQKGMFFGGGFEMYQTDDRGVYRIYGLPEGRFLVSVGYAQREGSISIGVGRLFYPQTFHPDVTEESQAKAIEVTDGSESTGVDIRVAEPKKTYDVYGRVVNADTGQPAAGLEIARGSFLQNGRMGGYGSGGELSGPNGEFHLTGVPPGRYGIFVQPSADSDFHSEPTMTEIGDGDVHGIEVKVRQGSTINGVLVVEGSSDPAVLAGLKQMQIGYNLIGNAPGPPNLFGSGARINADGSFRLRGVQPGKVRILASPMGNVPGLMLSRIEHNGVPVDREGIVVAAGEAVTG